MDNQIINAIVKLLEDNFSAKLNTIINDRDFFLIKGKIVDFIYRQYTGIGNFKPIQLNGEELKSKLELLVKKINNNNNEVQDKNWQFDLKEGNYSKNFGKFLVNKAGEYRLVEPGTFLFSKDFEDSTKRYVNLLITQVKKIVQSDGGTWFLVSGNFYLGNSSIVRIYFNFNYSDFDEIIDFIKLVSDELNSRLIPFNIKISPHDTNRTDAGVLYVLRDHYFITLLVIQYHLANKPSVIKDGIPLFTKYISNGIGFAEDPVDGKFSFGETISNTIATGYINAYRSKSKDKSQKVVKHLESKGFSIDELFRNPNTKYPYYLQFPLTLNCSSANKDNSTDTYKLYAWLVGHLICRQAIITHKNDAIDIRWIGAFEDVSRFIYYKVIDDSFENGRLGIIYFLAQLYFFFPTDWLLKYICICTLKSMDLTHIDKTKLQEIDSFLNLKNIEIEEPIVDAIEIKKNIKKLEIRGVSSKNDDDAFNPTVDEGYAGIGLNLLAAKTEIQLDDVANKFLSNMKARYSY